MVSSKKIKVINNKVKVNNNKLHNNPNNISNNNNLNNKPNKVTTINKPKKVTTISKPKKVTTISKPKKVTTISKPKKVTTINKPNKVITINKPNKVNTINKPKKVNTINKPKKVNTTTNKHSNNIIINKHNKPNKVNTTNNKPSNSIINNKPSNSIINNKPNKVNNTTNKPSNSIINNKPNKQKLNKVVNTLAHSIVNNSKQSDIIFNKVLAESLKNKNIYKNINIKISEKSKFKTIDEYQSDFNDITLFKKKFTKKEIDDINLIIYHDENNDGLISGSIAFHYLKENNNNIQLLGLKPVHGKDIFIRNPDMYRNKHLLILDLDYNNEYLKKLSELCESIIVIDDHQKGLNRANNSTKIKVFRGRDEQHATCAYVWKFFYPKTDIPITVQFIDDSDLKLFLPFYPRKVSNAFSQAIGHRFSHNKSPEFIKNKRSGLVFIELWDIITEKTLSYKYLIFVGKYYDEVVESLKNQIAINAKPAKFQGYDVAVLNFNAPGIKKQVGRQIMSNYRAMGSNIKFAVLWGYEYTNNWYDVTIIDDHSQYSTINLKEIAQKLGYIGGTNKGGGGHLHEAHFYWPKNDKYDIWDLFTKKFI